MCSWCFLANKPAGRSSKRALFFISSQYYAVGFFVCLSLANSRISWLSSINRHKISCSSRECSYIVLASDLLVLFCCVRVVLYVALNRESPILVSLYKIKVSHHSLPLSLVSRCISCNRRLCLELSNSLSKCRHHLFKLRIVLLNPRILSGRLCYPLP